jgi:hypothetical protein
MEGNIQLKVGERFDTGMKYIGADGVPRPVLRKILAIDSLPNAGAKNFAHSESLIATRYAKATIWASNGTICKTENSIGVTIDITATNVAITTTTDLSLYVNGLIVLDFCL